MTFLTKDPYEWKILNPVKDRCFMSEWSYKVSEFWGVRSMFCKLNMWDTAKKHGKYWRSHNFHIYHCMLRLWQLACICHLTYYLYEGMDHNLDHINGRQFVTDSWYLRISARSRSGSLYVFYYLMKYTQSSTYFLSDRHLDTLIS